MRSDNLQLPCVQPPTFSYNFQLPHGCHSHGGHGRHVGQVGTQDRTGRDGTGRDGTGQDRTRHDGRGRDGTKLTFKLDFPDMTCDWQLSQFLRCLNIGR